ncbi:MAG: putative Response regulator [Nitrospira sp.]|jgi:CheY-like chemotaxis protein|nr:putative Response regulator [Nitrospira sp.]
MPKILIADDSIAVRKVAERLLTEAGMGVTLAANGSEALALLNKDRPDLIVSDVIMPDKSGYEVCAFIRAQANFADIPVLLISGIVNDEVSRQAEFCKADGVLKKPFQGTSLKDRVLDLLTKRTVKSPPIQEPILSPIPADRSASENRPEDPIIALHVEPQYISGQSKDSRREIESATLPHVQAESAGLLMDSLGAKEPYVDSSVRESVSGDLEKQHALTLTLRDARITELEEQLASERRQNQEYLQDMQNALNEHREQVAYLSSRTQTLDQQLKKEGEQRVELLEQLADASRHIHRVDELETALSEERHRTKKLAEQISDSAFQSERICELDAALAAERDAAVQLVQQITSLEYLERHARDLETTLTNEREEAAHLSRQRLELESIVAQVPVLEEALKDEQARVAELAGMLSAERQNAADLLVQVKQLEEAAERVQQLDRTLLDERERSAQLETRAIEAEQMAEQSNRRFEDMVRKLGEIAGLASQLGNGKR